MGIILYRRKGNSRIIPKIKGCIPLKRSRPPNAEQRIANGNPDGMTGLKRPGCVMNINKYLSSAGISSH